MSSDVRSISFVMYGSKGLEVLIHVEEAADGNLHFSYEVEGKAELRGLFFDFNNGAVIDDLVVSGPTVTNQQVGDEAVSNLNDGNNMKGTKEEFDVGITFGTSGKGKDLTTTGEFELSSQGGTPLTLDDIANVTFGARFSSMGLKLVSTSPAAPDAIDDAITTDEDSPTNENAPNANLISNDTDADGDALTVVAINGDSALVGSEFTLSTGGLININSDGSFDLDPNGAYEDLAVGEIREDSFTYRITDELLDPSNQGFDTATASITVFGVNDAPIISVGGTDSESETVIETNGNLNTSGSLTVHDVDLSDVVEASVHEVFSSDNDTDPLTPDNGTLHAMLSLNPEAPSPILDGSEDTDTLVWNFDSGSEAFGYLATDEILTLEYTVRALDDNGAHDDHIITITVDGTNDAPVIAVNGGDSDSETILESNGNLNVSGTLTVDDIDRTDLVEASILSVSTSDNDSDPSTPANSALLGMLSLNPAAPSVVLDGSEITDTLSWTFDSGNEAFDYLATDEFLTLEYTVQALDDNGASDDHIITITIDGTNDAPVAGADNANTIEDQSVTLSVLANDSDIDTTDVLSVSQVSVASNGSVSITPDSKQIVYTPNAHWSGVDSFTYTVSDGNGGFDTATATVQVEAVADVPDLSVSVAPGATVNDVVLNIDSGLIDNDGSESYILDFSSLPSGVTMQGASGGQISAPSGNDQIILSLDEGVDFDFDFFVTAISTEALNGDTAQSTQIIDIILDSESSSENVSFEANNQSIWNTGSEFTFGDNRFLGLDKSGSDTDNSGLFRSNLSYNIKAGLQSDLKFEGGDIDAEIPWQVDFQTDYNRTTDVLKLDTGAFLLNGGSFNTVGPSLEYKLDFIFNYDIDTDVRLVVDFGEIDFEVVSFDLGSLSKTIFNFDKSSNNTINLIDYDSVTSGGLSLSFPYGITGTIEWPNLEVTGSEGATGIYSGNGASNNALNVNLDIDDALADIFLGGKNPFDLSANLGVAGGSLETLDVDVAAGFNFLQAFQLNAGTLSGKVIFEDNSSANFSFGDELIFSSASNLDSNGDGNIDLDLEMYLQNTTLSNDTDLGFNVGWNLDILDGSWWIDISFGKGSFAGIEYDLGGYSNSGGFGPIIDLGQDQIPVVAIDVFSDIIGVNFQTESIGLLV